VKIKIILLLVVSLLIVGCIEKQALDPKSTETKTKSTETKTFIQESSYKELFDKVVDCKKSSTTMQCDNWVNTYVYGKYVDWHAEVSDVDGNILYADCIGCVKIRLYDVDEKTLMQLKPVQTIRFSGRIIYPGKNDITYSSFSRWIWDPELHDVKIIEVGSQPTQSPKVTEKVIAVVSSSDSPSYECIPTKDKGCIP
jgi:hypothetical protein